MIPNQYRIIQYFWLCISLKNMDILNNFNLKSFEETSSSFPYRLAAIDLDDTLLGLDKQISAANVIAVRQLQQRGVRVILASGRGHENMLRFHRHLGLSGPIVSSQGALVKDAETEEILHKHFVSSDLATEVVAEAKSRNLAVIYYHADGMLVGEQNKWTDMYQSRTGDEIMVYDDLTHLVGETPQKVIWCGAPEQVAPLWLPMQMRYRERLSVLTTDPEFLEFMAKGVNKAVGVAAVAKHYGFEPAQVLAFGDGNNDIEMLKWAGLGVAMSDARPSAKAAATLVAPSGNPETSLARAVAAVLKQ